MRVALESLLKNNELFAQEALNFKCLSSSNRQMHIRVQYWIFYRLIILNLTISDCQIVYYTNFTNYTLFDHF